MTQGPGAQDAPMTPATEIEQIIPPEQPPMDDAAGPQDASDVLPPDEAADDLRVQGGE